MQFRLLALAGLLGLALGDSAPLPPAPDKVLTANSTTAPAGCKLLASDKGFPAVAPAGFIPKKKGTLNPDWTVIAKTVEQVQAAVKFAAETKVRLTVISRGHDFMGREAARSGVRIDVSNWQDIKFATSWKCGDDVSKSGTDTIKPVAGQQAVAHVRPGANHEMFYSKAHKSGLFVMGAQHGGVSVIGGWMQGGGHNPFLTLHGFGSDQVVEIEVVTPTGQYKKVNQCSSGTDADLFWAIRGGAGSTFGVVTGATVKVHPTIPIVVARWFVNGTLPGVSAATAHFVNQGPNLGKTYGMMGYFYVYKNAFQSVLHFPANYANMTNAKAAVIPLKTKMEQLAGVTAPQEVKYYEYKSYNDWYIAENGNHAMEDSGQNWLSFYDGSDGSAPGQGEAMRNPMLILPWALKSPQGPSRRMRKMRRDARWLETRQDHDHGSSSGDDHHGGSEMPPDDDDHHAGEMAGEDHHSSPARAMARTYLDSRLLPDSVAVKVTPDLIQKTFPAIDNAHVRGFLYGPTPVDPKSSLNPYWRSARFHFIINAVPGDIRRDYSMAQAGWDAAFPDLGAYINEASPAIPNFKKRFWGGNYAKLLTIKKRVDPQGVLWCSPCVGADEWTYSDERICPAPRFSSSDVAPQTYVDMKSTTGIASLPGTPGITNPLLPVVMEYLKSGKLPEKVPVWDENGNIVTGGTTGGGHAHGEGEGHEETAPDDGDGHSDDDDHHAMPMPTTTSAPAVVVTTRTPVATTAAAGGHGHEDGAGHEHF